MIRPKKKEEKEKQKKLNNEKKAAASDGAPADKNGDKKEDEGDLPPVVDDTTAAASMDGKIPAPADSEVKRLREDTTDTTGGCAAEEKDGEELPPAKKAKVGDTEGGAE